MKKLSIILLFAPTILFAQEKGFGVYGFHNTMYDVELFTYNNFVINEVPSKNPSLLVGVYYASIGKNKPLSIRHGVDVFIPTQRPMMNAAPRRTYTFITNSLSYSFLNKKALNASLRTDLKFLLEKNKFERELPSSTASRLILGGGFSVQPLPKKNPLKLVYQVNLTPFYIETRGNLDVAYHYSHLGLEFSF